MIRIICFLWFLSSPLLAIAQQSSDDFRGKWKTEDGYTIEIRKKGQIYEGTNVELEKRIFDKLEFKNGEWTTVMTRPRDGLTADATFTLLTDTIQIIVRKGFLSKKLTWKKV